MNENKKPTDQEIEAAKEKLKKAKQELQKAEQAWEDDGFVDALKEKSQEEKDKALKDKLEVGKKILEIENAQMNLITDRVAENSKELESATKELGDSLETLTNVTRILDAVGALLSIVTRILAL